MVYLISAHTVEDAAQWKAGFDSEEGVAMRKRFGCRSHEVYQLADDPNTLVVMTEVDDVEAGRKFLASDELKQAMKMSGVKEMLDSISTSSILVEMEKGSV